MQYTQNPELDAAAYDDELEAAQELHDEAARKAPEIVMSQFKKLTKPSDWFDKYAFAAGQCADEILGDGIGISDEVANAYCELMLSPAAEKLREAMANHFAKIHAFTIYTEYMDEQS